MARFAARSVSMLAWLALAGSAFGQGQAEDDAAAKRASEFLQSVVGGMRVSTDRGQVPSHSPNPVPLFRYSDPARVYPAAGVWRLGAAGRPPVLVSLEYWTRGETPEPRIMFEYLSFSSEPIRIESGLPTSWRSDGSAAKFAALPGAPPPASTKNQRLVQMRSLARRFSATEKHMEDAFDLRLLPQPIERYEDEREGITDAAIFIFAYGTNPELVLLLEATADGWQYSALRMSWAELVIKLDDEEIARFEQLTTFPLKGPYQTTTQIVRPFAGDGGAESP